MLANFLFAPLDPGNIISFNALTRPFTAHLSLPGTSLVDMDAKIDETNSVFRACWEDELSPWPLFLDQAPVIPIRITLTHLHIILYTTLFHFLM